MSERTDRDRLSTTELDTLEDDDRRNQRLLDDAR